MCFEQGHGHPGRYGTHAGPGDDFRQLFYSERRNATTPGRCNSAPCIAAAELKCEVSALAIHDGVVIVNNNPSGGRQLPLGTLAGSMSLALRIDSDAPLKAPTDYRIVGKPVPRLDIPDKVNGRFTYMQDFELPGMPHGRVVRPSGIGATLVSYDQASINHIPGIVKVVRIGNFLGYRGEAAERFEVSVASAVKWLQRWRQTRSATPKLHGGSISALEEFAAEILTLMWSSQT